MSFPVFGQPFGSQFGRSLGQGGEVKLTQAQIFDTYIATLSPLLDLRMNITSGTNIPNQGSLGAPQNGALTLGVGSLAQASPLGAGEAISWDALDTKITVPNSAAFDGIPKYTIAMLCKPNGAGEGNNGFFYCFGNSAAAAQLTINHAVNAVQPATGNAVSISSGTTFIPFGSWQMVFIQYDDTSDRKLHVFKGIGGTVTESPYGTQTAATGTESVISATFYIGNRALADFTFDGLFSRFLYFDTILTAPQKQNITIFSGT